MRRLYQAEKAGHTGSLDPLATGLLPVCFGQATKLSGLLLDADKRYTVRAKVGECTDSGDANGSITTRSDSGKLNREMLVAAIPEFTGNILQIPPMYSALKKDGERLYEIARRGETVEREPRPLTIHNLSLTAFEGGYFELDVRCSKGTYIRSLVEDVARAAGQSAHVVALRRLESGPFGAQGMHTLEDLQRAAESGLPTLDSLLLPVLEGLSGWRRHSVDAEQARRLSHGQVVELRPKSPAGPVAVLGPGGELLGLGEVSAYGTLLPRTWMTSAA